MRGGNDKLMKRRSFVLLLSMLTVSTAIFGASPILAQSEAEEAAAESADAELEDGIYTAEFDTDSSMFRVNEANDGKGILTVKDGEMTIHVSLGSKNIVNLFAGMAEDAQRDGAELLEPTTDTVTYSDGISEEVYGFDIPVPALEDEFDVALIGKKGKWYDHKVSVSDPEKIEGKILADLALEDGDYTIGVTLTGGSGRSTIDSPALLKVEGDEAIAQIAWSSPNYDYMLVDGEKYAPVNEDGNSVFEIPVTVFDAEMEVTADTIAMSTPHEIDYTLRFDAASIRQAEE